MLPATQSFFSSFCDQKRGLAKRMRSKQMLFGLLILKTIRDLLDKNFSPDI